MKTIIYPATKWQVTGEYKGRQHNSAARNSLGTMPAFRKAEAHE